MWKQKAKQNKTNQCRGFFLFLAIVILSCRVWGLGEGGQDLESACALAMVYISYQFDKI